MSDRPDAPAKGLRLVRNEFIPIAVLGLFLLVLIALDIQGLPAPLALLRLLLGLAFVLFVPGYVLQAALFPRAAGLDGPERLALSFGLSVAVVPPVALVLDRLPWGIRLWPVVAAEALLIVACSAVAWVRRRRLPEEERFQVIVDADVKGWWAAQDRTNRILYGILAGALLTAAVSALVIVVLPKPAERFTEFYVLGPEGLPESYPREAVVGQPLSVTAGIANREGVPAAYRIEVWAGEEQIGAMGPLSLQDGAVWEGPLFYALPQAGDDQQVEFLLFKESDDAPGPYRQLRLWLNVAE